MSLSERPYLSIGEVLGLLLDEFPDVSISKIRFLESQGLIGPERTPSGYRKFYDADVERLRVILREQRENFLPLRVIRDRLESGEIDDTGGQQAPRGARDSDDDTSADDDTGSDDTGSDDTGSGPVRGTRADPLRSPSPGSTEPTAGYRRDGEDMGDETDDDDTDGLDVPADEVRTSNHPAAMHRPASAPQPPSAPRAADFFAPGGDVPPTVLPIPRSEFTAGDVCALAGLTPRQLGELETYGLVTPAGTGTTAIYTPDDLAIATIAAKFMASGIDARHLRGWKQAAEREAALFEQLVAPLLRQRNPQSRQNAADKLADLAALGAELRSALLRIVLGDRLEP